MQVRSTLGAALAAYLSLLLTGCATFTTAGGTRAVGPPSLAPAPLRWSPGVDRPGVAAVLIAADTYHAQPSWGLPSARSSVEAVRTMLVTQRGIPADAIQVLTDQQVASDYVEAAILAAGERLRGSEHGALWVYYCGHGWVQDGEQQLFTHLTREEAGGYSKVIKRGDLVGWMAKARAQAGTSDGVLIVDACRRNVGDPPPRAKLIRSDVWELYGVKEGRLVAAGSGGAPFAFTGCLVEAARALGSAAGEANLARLFEEARVRTLRVTQVQEPELVVPTGSPKPPAAISSRRVRFVLRVVDALSGVALRGVRVAFDDNKLRAAAGECTLEGSRSEHVLQVQADGYLGRTERFVLDVDQQGAGLELALYPAMTLIRGEIDPPTVARAHATCDGLRADYHVAETVSDAMGRFELRVPTLVGTRVELRREGAILKTVELPTVVGHITSDAEGRFDGIGVVNVRVSLPGQTVAHPEGEPTMRRPADRSDWERAKKAVDDGRYDLARADVAKLVGGDAFVRYCRWLDSRWAEHELEAGLRAGKEQGEWAKADAVVQWWTGASRKVDNHARVQLLVDEYVREHFPLEVRRQYEAGNAALAEGRLEDALAAYESARPQLSPHYVLLIAPHIARLRASLYDRHMSAGRQAELERAWRRAFSAHASAARYDLLARRDAKRILSEHPELEDTPEARAFRLEEPQGPSGWDCEVLERAAGGATGLARRVLDKRSGIIFRLVPAGEFQMGSIAGDADEAPVHKVRITKPFYLAETETTQAQWEAVMGTNPSSFAGARRPVENVSWADADAFMRKFNGGDAGPFRLPTEAEWEYACRAGTTTEYSVADAITIADVHYRDYLTLRLAVGFPETVEVGTLPANAWGFHEMHGNVAEWCQDWYEPTQYQGSGELAIDPIETAPAATRVLRGGSRGDFKRSARSANREGTDPALRNHYIGFRAARSL